MSLIKNDEIDAILEDIKVAWESLASVAMQAPGAAEIVGPRSKVPQVIDMVFEQAKSSVASETRGTLAHYIVVIHHGKRQAVFGVIAADKEAAISKVLARNTGWQVTKVVEKNEPTVFRIFDDAWYEAEHG